jgi:two-component system nitrogen regulation response regulator NtrX
LLTPPKVLIVEDDPAIRGLLIAAMRREPLSVDAAADGVEALERVRDNNYAVIITDLMLPRLDGAAFIEAFTRLRPNAGSVIFVMTAFDESASVRKLGPAVHAVVRKPFDVEKLVGTIRECALLRQQHEMTGGGAEPEPPSLTSGPC